MAHLGYHYLRECSSGRQRSVGSLARAMKRSLRSCDMPASPRGSRVKEDPIWRCTGPHFWRSVRN